MFTASEFRRIARDKLRGHWGRSVLVTFIFSLICGMSGIYNLAKNMGHMDFDMLFAGNYNDFLAGFAAADTETSLFGSLIALVLSIVVLLFSGALEMGLTVRVKYPSYSPGSIYSLRRWVSTSLWRCLYGSGRCCLSCPAL